jgi:hypothetical protein
MAVVGLDLDDTICDPIHLEKKQSRLLKKLHSDSQIAMFYDPFEQSANKIS